MADRQVYEQETLDPDLEWLAHVRPQGLVFSSSLLKELGLVPQYQTQRDTYEVLDLLGKRNDCTALPDPWTFVENVLGWPADKIAGAPGGPGVPEELSVRLPEHETTLRPDWAVQAPGHGGDWQLLVQLLEKGVDPDQRAALEGWEATPQQRFERLLRESRVEIGVLISDAELRLIYAPRGETSGWLAFPLRELATVAGRSMLGGLKLALGRARLFTDPERTRLPNVHRESREKQATVSQELAKQLLGALHELLRGVLASDEGARVRRLAEEQPQHLYEGLLTVLLRLVFVLYAEDRDLLPSHRDSTSRDLYEQGYSVRGLHAQLLDDAARNPDTMEERYGGWGRLLALFRLIHGGHRSGWIKERGGQLFDPDRFPFLEGRGGKDEPPRVPGITDGCVLRILDGLLMLHGERLSYRTLDVEQIGSVYETVIGFTVQTAEGPTVAIKGGKHNSVPVFVDLSGIAEAAKKDRGKRLKDAAHRANLTKKQEDAIKAAEGPDDLATVLAQHGLVDERGTPGDTPLQAGTPILQPTEERRRTGSHYTPRSLTEPIVRHALEPAYDRLGDDATPGDVLSLKVCDPAMGSGAFLVEACRQLATRLVKAWRRWPAERPRIPDDEDEDLHARRLVAQRCLYGVDRNPMAVDLGRLSLWLATLARDHEFTFLDHALKCGDSLVGLSLHKIRALHWDESKPPMALFGSLVQERVDAAVSGRREIMSAPDDVTRETQESRHRRVEGRLDHVRILGDAVISAFFATDKAKARETERQKIEQIATAPGGPRWGELYERRATLQQGAYPVIPFHWEVEFPEVFQGNRVGFDAMVGNPPFAGKNTIKASHRNAYIEWLKALHKNSHGNADLVAHFFRRAFNMIGTDGSFGLIATNTIAQGDTRETGLASILKKWPDL